MKTNNKEQLISIKFPENATPEEIEEQKKTLMEVIHSFEKLVGEEGKSKVIFEGTEEEYKKFNDK